MGCHYDNLLIHKEISCPYCGASFNGKTVISRSFDCQYQFFKPNEYIGKANMTGFYPADQMCENCKESVDFNVYVRGGQYIDIFVRGTELDVDFDSLPEQTLEKVESSSKKIIDKNRIALFQVQETAVQNKSYIDFDKVYDTYGKIVSGPIENGDILFTCSSTHWKDETGVKCRLFFAADYDASTESVKYYPRCAIRESDSARLDPIGVINEANRG